MVVIVIPGVINWLLDICRLIVFVVRRITPSVTMAAKGRSVAVKRVPQVILDRIYNEIFESYILNKLYKRMEAKIKWIK